mgnify:CR=1 FL=1
MSNKTIVILENIRSAHNVGAIFRTADGAGSTKIFLVGYTPTPTDRFGRAQPEIKKTSLGASDYVPWEYHETIKTVRTALAGVPLIAVEQTKDAVPYTEYQGNDAAFIFGNEVEGVSAAAIAAADRTIHVPMSGQKESLNLATTAAICLSHYRDA